jgi:uncharacterized protein
VQEPRAPTLRARITVFIITIQSILFFGHWFVYETWTGFRAEPDPAGITGLQAMLGLLSISFVIASLLAYRYSNSLVRLFYRLAAVWLGTLSFLFVAACSCWIAYLGARLFKLQINLPAITAGIFGVGVIASLYGIVNARWIRVKHITVKMPHLPPSWRGRVAAQVTDVHLGHVNGRGFMRRLVAMLQRLKPDIVFITGDLFDGSKVEPHGLVSAWRELSAPFGAYFVTGNHEEFSDPGQYLDAIRRSGVRVLDNEKVIIDGVQIVGVNHHDSVGPERFRSVLKAASLDPSQASILLSHSPHGLPIAEEAGVSLQLSGHTHGGQFFPFTWFTRRIFGEYTYGLRRFRDLIVNTSYGAGTWGPPMRVGTRPEIVLIEFA